MMLHCEPETLALAALGEEIPAEDQMHLDACAQCLTEVTELVELVAIAREAPRGLPPVPASVWDGIRGELGLGEDGREGESAGSGPEGRPGSSATVVDLDSRRSRRRMFTVAAVAATAGAIVGGSVVWSALDRSTQVEAPVQLVAQAVLNPLSSSVAEPGKAQVLDSPDGQVIRVDARSLPKDSGFHEVWLIDKDVTKLVALGALPSGSVGTFTIPPGVHIEDFPVVDISLEPYDGDPGHSHQSLMRGILEA